jgi:hypothetical protein
MYCDLHGRHGKALMPDQPAQVRPVWTAGADFLLLCLAGHCACPYLASTCAAAAPPGMAPVTPVGAGLRQQENAHAGMATATGASGKDGKGIGVSIWVLVACARTTAKGLILIQHFIHADQHCTLVRVLETGLRVSS